MRERNELFTRFFRLVPAHMVPAAGDAELEVAAHSPTSASASVTKRAPKRNNEIYISGQLLVQTVLTRLRTVVYTVQYSVAGTEL